MDNNYSRYISSFIMSFAADLMSMGIHRLGCSLEEIAILCAVLGESTSDLRNDTFLKVNYGSEDYAFPNEYRKVVRVKYVQEKLGLSRETARRRLEGLVARNLLVKKDRGYIFPAQVGEQDYTKDIRGYLLVSIRKLDEFIKSIPPSSF